MCSQCDIKLQGVICGGVIYPLLKTTEDDIEWSHSRRVDCAVEMHSPHDIKFQAGIVYLSLKTRG